MDCFYSENKNTENTKQNKKYANQNTKYAKQNTKYAISIKRVRQKKNEYAKNWYNLQYVNLYSKILIYAASKAFFVANLRTFLAYLLQA